MGGQNGMVGAHRELLVPLATNQPLIHLGGVKVQEGGHAKIHWTPRSLPGTVVRLSAGGGTVLRDTVRAGRPGECPRPLRVGTGHRWPPPPPPVCPSAGVTMQHRCLA